MYQNMRHPTIYHELAGKNRKEHASSGAVNKPKAAGRGGGAGMIKYGDS